MADFMRNADSDPLIRAGVLLLTPPLREIYAILVRAGVLSIED